MLIFYIILFLLAVFILVKSATFLTRALIGIAVFFNLSEFTAAFILIAISTSIPELFIGITSALNRAPLLALGNIIGANIIDLSLAVGIPIVLAKGIQIKSEIARRDTFYMFLVVVIAVLLMLDGEVSRADGLILLLIFILYFMRLFHLRGEFRKPINHTLDKAFIKNLLFFALGVVLLLISASIVVKLALILTKQFNLSLILFGLLIIALGTTLPELSFRISAVLKQHKEMALGSIFGSIISNLTLVLGTTAVIYPIKIINFSFLFTAAFFMVLGVALLIIFIRSKEKLSWQEGLILILFYVLFLIIEVMMR